MPIFKEIVKGEVQIFIWQYNENDGLENEGLIENKVYNRYCQSHTKRQKEMLIVRKIIKTFLPHHQLKYKENGEPYLLPLGIHISISHSFPFVALAISKNKMGIDLEKLTPRIKLLKDKFLTQTELSWIGNKENEMDLLSVIWTIKEALYKIHPVKYWSFREHYEVQEFNLLANKNIQCRVFDRDVQDEYTASFLKINDFYLSIVVK